MSAFISGLNPLTITQIVAKGFTRIGEHPYKRKLLVRKYGQFLGEILSSSSRSAFLPAAVFIYGSSGVLKSIACRSNAHAQQLRDELERKLETFLSNLLVEEFTDD